MKEKSTKIDAESLKLKRTIVKQKAAIVILSFTLAITLMILLLIYFGLINVGYDSNKEKQTDNTNTSADVEIVQDTVTSIERIEITDVDQVANVNGIEYKIKKSVTVDGAYLLINDVVQELPNTETAYADIAYVTNQYIIFAVIAQDGESITYAIDQNGNQITVDNTEYQMHDFIVVDGNLQASGHIFCGLDEECPDKAIIIKYEDNSIKVMPIE